MGNAMNKIVVAVLAAVLCFGTPRDAWAWGQDGHRVVGAIADILLEQHPATKAKIRKLLGASLSEAATWADCAKGFNYCHRSPSPREAAYTGNNPHNHNYHYTDIPEQQTRYKLGTAGTKPYDIVQVSKYAIGVLRGTPRKASDPAILRKDEAVWLLAHLVGDLHQPLHVGSLYFDSACEKPVDPNKGGKAPDFGIGTTVADTTGGNDLQLRGGETNLHHYWDDIAVMTAAGLAANGTLDVQDFARRLAASPPAGTATPGPPAAWPEAWATEILPLARQALDRVSIVDNRPVHANTLKCRWHVSHDRAYAEWAGQRAAEQLAKAGYRLAALMIALLGP
jgi:hypothetical protein